MKSKVVIYLLFLTGCVSLFAGLYNLYTLYDKSNTMEHTVGVVTHLKTERTYRHRRIYYTRKACVQYETKLYSAHASMQLRNPFISQGSEITVWYNPKRTGEVIIPFEEGFVWGSVGIFGALCVLLGTGIIIIKKKT